MLWLKAISRGRGQLHSFHRRLRRSRQNEPASVVGRTSRLSAVLRAAPSSNESLTFGSIRSSQEHYLPMTDYEELHYPNLMAMKVTVVGSGGCTKPPVRLPAGCVEAAIFAPPSQKSEYDFTLGEWKFEILCCVPITSCLSIRESTV